jgi:hypothetical protein
MSAVLDRNRLAEYATQHAESQNGSDHDRYAPRQSECSSPMEGSIVVGVVVAMRGDRSMCPS